MFIDPFQIDGEAIFVVQAPGYEIELERKRWTELILPTGKLVVCDPIANPEAEAFSTKVQPGSYPVFAYFAHLRDDIKPAYIVLQLGTARPTRWEVALLDNEDPVGWNDAKEVGFHVETGVAGLMDVVAADMVLDTMATNDGEEEFTKAMRQKFKRTRRGNGVAWADLKFGLRDGTNLVAFEAADDVYATFWGYDPSGEITRVVIDLNVLDFQFTPYGIRLAAMGA